MWYERKWIEAHFRSVLPVLGEKKIDRREQQFNMDSIQRLPPRKGWGKKWAEKKNLCYSEKHEIQAFVCWK